MVDLSSERPMPLNEARKFIRRTYGVSQHLATIYRWAGAGVEGVRLETVSSARYSSAQVRSPLLSTL